MRHHFLRSLFLFALANGFVTFALMLRLENDVNATGGTTQPKNHDAAQRKFHVLKMRSSHIQTTHRKFVMVKGEACSAPRRV